MKFRWTVKNQDEVTPMLVVEFVIVVLFAAAGWLAGAVWTGLILGFEDARRYW